MSSLDSADAPSKSVALSIQRLTHRYGERLALNQLTLDVARGEVFGILGPNGSGKTTLFRVLSTLLPPQQGEVALLGLGLAAETMEVRRRMGVVFQAPSLDKKLTVAENIRHQAALYGVPRAEWKPRTERLLKQFRLEERANERTESLSGGLRRRAELAKGLVHEPEFLLLDEPSTGLDPGARADLWDCLRQLQADGATIVLTTHLLEEADRCDRLAILDRGELVALGAPDALRSAIGGDSLTLAVDDLEGVAEELREQFDLAARMVDGQVRLECQDGHEWVARLVNHFGDRIRAVHLGKPTLEDVFIHHTGRAATFDG